MKRQFLAIGIGLAVLLPSCQKDSGKDDNTVTYTVTMDPSQTRQEMVGFGGALTWYSDRVLSSPNKTAICHYLFEDLGADIFRFKNWYYPNNYPSNKSAESMISDGVKTSFNTTNQLYILAKQANPDVKVLLSSWGPPAALKSNNKTNNGTLAKDANGFVYSAFADYWNDILDYITFTPDYISIQNEPSWGTDGWETCVWRPSETSEYPGYENAFDSVYKRLCRRTNPPAMIGPEAENIGTSSFGGNTFGAFSDVLKDKPYLTMYCYHTYNFTSGTLPGDTESLLSMIGTSYGDKPNIMSEYSGMSWLKTAQFIIRNLNLANSSGYIYWDMVWGEDDDNAMIKINYSGDYSLTPFYFMMKHFAKDVNAGDHRIEAGSTSSYFDFSAFINSAGNKITLVIVNPLAYDMNIDFSITGKTITSVEGVQSASGSIYADLGALPINKPLTLKAGSVSTFVIDIQ
jgi:glucuronoarabinoxylan endo-1,4-beta-xylanase